MIAVGPLEPADHEAALALLTAAFADDGGVLAVIGGSDARRRARWFQLILRLTAATPGQAFCARDGDGLAGVLLLGRAAGAPVLPQLTWLVRALFSLHGGIIARTMAHDRARRSAMSDPRARIVEFVAVDATRRGQGIGAALFAAAHGHGGPFWLETTRPENLPIFARLGYREVGRRTEHGVSYFAMERP